MSDILIKGMEMPNRCFKCIFLTTVPNFFCLAGKRDLCAEHGINISRPDWCPLVEIPTPHGRLKDESDIISLIEVMFCKDKDGMEHAIQCVKDAPTVIEAEGETK